MLYCVAKYHDSDGLCGGVFPRLWLIGKALFVSVGILVNLIESKCLLKCLKCLLNTSPLCML